MTKKILIISPDRSGFGGAAINAEEIFNLVSKKYSNTKLLFIDSTKENLFLSFSFILNNLFNKKNSNNKKLIVHNFINTKIYYYKSKILFYLNYLELKLRKKSIKKDIIKSLKSEPNIIISKNYKGVLFAKKIFPKAKILFFCSGSVLGRYISECNLSYNKIINENIKITRDFYENYAVFNSDKIIFNSKLLNKFFQNFYNIKKNSEIVDTSNLIQKISKFENNKNYDLIFICSDFNRVDKNANFAYQIFSDKRLSNFKKILIGNNIKKINLQNTLMINLLNKKEVAEFIQKTKLLICTSFFDANPNVIKECIYLNTKFLISKNCGNFDTYPLKYVMNDIYDKDSWVKRIIEILKNNENSVIKINNENDCKQQILNIIHNTST